MQTNLKSVCQKIMLNDLIMMHDRFTLMNEKLMTLLCDQTDPKIVMEITAEIKTAHENYLSSFRSLIREIGDVLFDEESARSIFDFIKNVMNRNNTTMEHLRTSKLIDNNDKVEELTYGE